MKNNLLKLLICIFFTLTFFLNSYAQDQFNFNITEIEILENGNLFKGKKRGEITTDDGIKLVANEFEYNKTLNILSAQGKVEIEDKINNYKFYSEEIIYLKNDNIIFSKKKSKAIDLIDNIIIESDEFEYNKKLNKLNANQNVIIKDNLNDYVIYSENITYLKNEEKFFTKGQTKAIIQSKYNFLSKNVIFLKNQMELSANEKTTITTSNNDFYDLSRFKYFLNDEKLKGENITIVTNYQTPKNDKFYFKSGIFNLKNKSFIAKDPIIKVHNDVFNNPENDPRLKGVSASSYNNITKIKKGVFTSCKENKNCTPWSIKASEITHDKNKKQLSYDNALLKIYDVPVFYFPKFFHPDPSVERQSGLLQPQLNSSEILGSSFHLPYFKVLSDSKDFTFRPTYFYENKIKMFHGEYRQQNKHSSIIADIGFTDGYKSQLQNKKNSLFHLFTKYKKNLNLENYLNSSLDVSIEKVTNDTYLKVFDSSLSETILEGVNKDSLFSSANVNLDHKKFNLSFGLSSYENLNLKNSDRYTFVLPYYDFNKDINLENIDGFFNISSNGNNSLQNTNNLKSLVVNNLNYKSKDFISNKGFKNNFNFYFKNLNTIAKNDTRYKSRPHVSFANIYEFSSSLPLSKKTKKHKNTLTPKISFRTNPGGMDNLSDLSRRINISNIFDINRLGLNDEFESGQSMTLGLNFTKESLENPFKSIDYSLATVLRDKNNNKIPKSTTINNKTSNIFGSLKNNFSENFLINYDFSLQDSFNRIEYQSISTSYSVNNFATTFTFVEEDSLLGDANSIANVTSFNFAEKNFLKFATRRNRKIDLTEYYDLIYEYKNDCLVAGIKYRKTYYNDRELKPSENLLFTLTLIPLTSYEKQFDNKNGWLKSLE